MSIGFLAEQEEAIVWRGPKKKSMIAQLLLEVAWGDLDVLVIDSPPGTSDEHIALVSNLNSQPELKSRSGAVLVTTPQMASLQDVSREINFCRKTGINIYGVIENMSGFVCPHCNECTNIFNKGILISATSSVVFNSYVGGVRFCLRWRVFFLKTI